MITNTILRAAAGVCLVATAALYPLTAHAAAADYRFEVAGVKPAATGKSDVTLRLIHTPDQEAGVRMRSFSRSRPIWDRKACRR